MVCWWFGEGWWGLLSLHELSIDRVPKLCFPSPPWNGKRDTKPTALFFLKNELGGER
jgi:hypothetical protein